MSRFNAFLDTCVLVPPTLCDLVLRIAEQKVFGVRWSDDVLTELRTVLLRHGVTAELADKRLNAMAGAFPMAVVDGYSQLVPAMTNDEKDRHILAAAFRSDAHAIVTFNLRHFPADAVAPYELEVIHPDAFLLQQLDLQPGRVVAALRAQIQGSRRPPLSEADVLGRLRRTGLPEFADEVARHL